MQIVAFIAFLVLGLQAQLSLPGPSSDRIVSTHLKMRKNFAQGGRYIQGVRQPSAANMMKMAWDSSLATSAQNYAATCPTGRSGATGYGENIRFVYTTAPISPLDGYAIDAPVYWDQQFDNYGLPSLTMTSSILASGVADATQMAWAKSKLIGCGVTNCGPDASQNNKTKIVVICHYSPK
ncbi:hypothetical protein GCK72_020486 [Caenorhabditis remanei]|uniref:SCP domain-containing protein n=1 Tax=Caenorhabditis remanei TaxID=31234 RepID=A0A6A5GHL3_CAERE|nr:hypothetical protein GCK72_020486 [Caenorhabditis remanei]KAF1753929.1 hypothetical protein GCK72_020486 [Caenorhabditis remanei]